MWSFKKWKEQGAIKKKIFLLVFLVFCWLSFPLLVFSKDVLWNLFPILILFVQIAILKYWNIPKQVLFLLVHPVVIFVMIYTIKPTVNYLQGKPTKVRCCFYEPNEPLFDVTEDVGLAYIDDDCDFPGFYLYTLDVNNGVTDGLIYLFGNPIKS